MVASESGQPGKRVEQEKVLVVIFGPPAVGKMTVGQALSELTGLPLFHNHLTIEPLLRFFPFGHPSFRRLSTEFRTRLFEEVAQAPEHHGLIFTYVWALDDPRDKAYVDRMTGIFVERGARVCFVELVAPLEVRLERNRGAARLAEKPSKRDLERSHAQLLETERTYRMNTTAAEPFHYPEAYLRLDVTALSPGESALRIATHFGLSERAGSEPAA